MLAPARDRLGLILAAESFLGGKASLFGVCCRHPVLLDMHM